jgi:hypothetical protein
MNGYHDVFHIDLSETARCRLASEEPGSVAIAVDTPVSITVSLRVPVVTPADFPWSNGLVGHIVQIPRSSPRFCHPRLRSSVAERIARESDRQALAETTEYHWYFDNWYSRLHEAIKEELRLALGGRRQITSQLLTSRLQRAITQLLGGAAQKKGLPLTNEAMLLRQKFEFQLGYPDCLDARVYEGLKAKFLAHVDPFCDTLCTGKHDIGRVVLRTRKDGIISWVTGKPLPDMMVNIQPLAVYANPTRVYRENRSIVQCLEFQNPIPPPISVPGKSVPAAIQSRITTLLVAVGDIPGISAHIADEEIAEEFDLEIGEKTACDSIPITPTGDRKLRVKETVSDLMDIQEFEEEREELEALPNFEMEEIRNLVDVMADGTPIYQLQVRYRHTRDRRGLYNKLKFLAGGVKGVTRRITQLYLHDGNRYQPIDAVISEKTFLSKGATDLGLYALATMAGITEFNPEWSREQFGALIREGLVANGHPEDGRFPIFVREKVGYVGKTRLDAEVAASLRALGHKVDWRWQYRKVGFGIAGFVPCARAQESEERASSSNVGVRINSQTRNIISIPMQADPRNEQVVKELASFFYEGVALGERFPTVG